MDLGPVPSAASGRFLSPRRCHHLVMITAWEGFGWVICDERTHWGLPTQGTHWDNPQSERFC